MPLLLLIPFGLVALVALWAVLLPLALFQRYRSGTLRKRVLPWAAGLNAWGMTVSLLVFVAGAWIAAHWIEDALAHAAAGACVGALLGIAGLWIGRFERTPQGLYHTPNRWLWLLVTLAVAARIGYGLWQAWTRWSEGSEAWLHGQAMLFAVGGVLLGFQLATAWGVRARVREARG